MSETISIPLVAWSVDLCRTCGRHVAVLQTADGSELRLRLASRQAVWLIRGRHPTYARHLKPLLDGLAERSLRLELADAGSGTVSSSVVVSVDGELRREHISPALALLMFDKAGVPLWADGALLRRSGMDHFEDVVDVFADFLSTVSAEDFARFEAGSR